MKPSIDTTEFSRLPSEVLEAAQAQGNSRKEPARRARTTPETLSRVKARGSGDAELPARMGRIVRLRLAWLADDGLAQAIERGRQFQEAVGVWMIYCRGRESAHFSVHFTRRLPAHPLLGPARLSLDEPHYWPPMTEKK